MWPRILVALIAILVYAAATESATWYIKADGTGDAPSIQAGVDSATAGDTVLVGPGIHPVVDDIELPIGVNIISEAGPAVTILHPPKTQYIHVNLNNT